MNKKYYDGEKWIEPTEENGLLGVGSTNLEGKGATLNLVKKIPMSKSWVGLSSQVASTSYNEKEKYMIVQFNAGRYRYDEVPLEVWVQSLNTASIGKFINSTIKPNYAATKL